MRGYQSTNPESLDKLLPKKETPQTPVWTSSYTIDTDKLVAYFSFNGNTQDQSGNGNDGTLCGGASLTSNDRMGVQNNAVYCDGSNDYINIRGDSSLTDGSEQTIVLIAKPLSHKSNNVIYWDDNRQGGGDRGIELDSSGHVVAFRSSDGYGGLTSSGTLSIGSFYCLAFTMGSSVGRNIYIDGVLDAHESGVASFNHNGRTWLSVCSGHNGYRGYFHGVVDELFHYTRALDDAEISSLCNSLISPSPTLFPTSPTAFPTLAQTPSPTLSSAPTSEPTFPPTPSPTIKDSSPTLPGWVIPTLASLSGSVACLALFICLFILINKRSNWRTRNEAPQGDILGGIQSELEALRNELARMSNNPEQSVGAPGMEIELREVAPNEYNCPITGELMEDPVLASDGHTYERSAIEEWFRRSNQSPLTGSVLSSINVTPNYALKKLILDFKERQSNSFPTPSSPPVSVLGAMSI